MFRKIRDRLLHEFSNIHGLFGFKVNDTNCKVWSRMMEIHVAGLNKLGDLINGQIAMVDETEHGYLKWLTKATIVGAWLLKTIDLYLLGMFIELRTTKNIWDGVTQMFYDRIDQSQYYKF